ncbi:MAG TPA: zf-HC2 domain-containing protein [Blastocatellia bacterium]|jgi:hypothetical protein
MNHDYVEELDLIDRYLMGNLTAEESAQFEEHFVDCARCVDRLAITKEFIHGFRQMASGQPTEGSAYRSRRLHWYSPRSLSPKWFALASGFLLLAVVAGAVVMLNRVKQARTESAQWEQRFEQEHQSFTSADGEHREAQRELTERVARLQAELDSKRDREIASPGETPAQINLPILELRATRGGESQADSINKLMLRSAARFLMLVSLESELSHKSYRITIQGDGKKFTWKRDGLKPNRYGALSVLFSSNFFPPGDYVVLVEGVNAGGATSVVGEYRFRV